MSSLGFYGGRGEVHILTQTFVALEGIFWAVLFHIMVSLAAASFFRAAAQLERGSAGDGELQGKLP